MPLIDLFPTGVPDGLGLASVRSWDLNSPYAKAFFSGSDEYMIDPMAVISSSEAWRRSIWVRRCVMTIARNIGRLPFEVYRYSKQQAPQPNKKKTRTEQYCVRSGRTRMDAQMEPVANHPVLDIIRAPNSFTSTFGLMFGSVSCVLLKGEAFWILGKTSGDTPYKALLMDPSNMNEDLTRDKLSVDWWKVRMPDGTMWRLNPLDVLHIKNPDPFKLHRGTSPLEAAYMAVTGDLAAQEHNIGFFQRGASVDGVLESDQNIPEIKGKEILRSFEARHRKAHRTAILDRGLKFKDTHQNLRDMEFSVGREKNREEILGIFGVPPTVVGIESANFATAREQRKGFWTDTLIPHAQLVADAIKAHFLTDDNLECGFNVDHIEDLAEDLDKKIERGTKLFAMGVPFNAIDEHLDIGIGEQEGGDVGYLPISLQPVDIISEKALLDLNPPAPPAAPPPADKQPKDQPPADAPKQKSFLDFVAMGQEIGRVLSADEREVTPAVTEFNASMREALPDEVLRAILAIIQDDAELLKSVSIAYFSSTMKIGGDQMLELLGKGSTFDINSPQAIAFLETKLMKITRISDVTQEIVRQTILDAMAQGADRGELAKAIKGVYNDFSSKRAKGIARTELAQAMNGGRFQVLKEEGVTEHEWLNSEDERVRETHELEGGHVVTVGDEFPVTGLMFPCDPDGPADEVIGCRCITLPAEAQRASHISEGYWRKATTQWIAQERRYTRTLQKFFFRERSKILELIAA